MRAVVQRVNKASVSVKSKVVGEIAEGLFILVGFKKGDTKKEVDIFAGKLLKLRVMADPPAMRGRKALRAGKNGKMNLSVIDSKSQILVVSQFTLYANTKDGNRPSFSEAEATEKANELYEHFVNKLKESGLITETGIFGEYMKIDATLDGPVTIVL